MSNENTEREQQQDGIKPPTPVARKFVNYIVGFGVGVGVGLAPYLGLLEILLFKPLLTLIPETIQYTIIPLSAALMGTVAVVIQWYAREHLSLSGLRSYFKRTLSLLIITFATLVVIHTLVVVSVPILGGKDSVSFIVGFARPTTPPCPADVSDAECIKRLTLNPSIIASFWGDRQVRIATLLLIFLYLFFTGSFGTLIGLIILREQIPSNA